MSKSAQSIEITLQNKLQSSNRNRFRKLKDQATTLCMGVGGIGVIIAIVLIFFYLIYVVYPLFIPADIEKISSYTVPELDAGKTVYLAIEEQNEVGSRFTDRGGVVFFDTKSGQTVKQDSIPVPRGAQVTGFAAGGLAGSAVIYGFSNGQAIIARHIYKVRYQDEGRTITPGLEYPLGVNPVTVFINNNPVQNIAFQYSHEQTTIVAQSRDNQLTLVNLTREESFFGEEEQGELTSITTQLPRLENITNLLIDSDQRLLYVVQGDREISIINISDKENPRFIESRNIVKDSQAITRISFLAGGISLLVGTSDGRLEQWMPVKVDNNIKLEKIREFSNKGYSITDIVSEQRRKGFVTANSAGEVAIHHSTANHTVLRSRLSGQSIQHITISPRADTLLAEDVDGNFEYMSIQNEHPEISWAVIWQKIWYESYQEPSYTWQSSSASNDFEPKYSFMPLVFGTLKAALYAMLFAMPLAIMGAIYTAYFMAPAMRTYVKPTIEIMEALPTVILGFLAGLWLAPIIESHLPGVFSLLLILPPGVLIFAWLWQRLPKKIHRLIQDGWQAAILIPVILLIGVFAFTISQPLENLLFDGNMRQWLGSSLGLEYDQRNSIVVGIAMGIAVIPTIFSITEDAIFSVPKHLTIGSLALGATPWQTLVRVVILTASPGIFSAVMIGFGRAVGETMIVLMATGNTPVMDLSIFQGMRTLSANIAVEMPESELNSTHYRILFLAALVLFLFTFVFNTIAEIVRQRLRKKYSSL